MRGVVRKAFSGRYLVVLPDGERLVSPLGRLRQLSRPILTGDEVEVEGGVIVRVYEPRTVLRRPPVANVDVAFVLFTLARPAMTLLELDRLLCHVAKAGIDPVIVAHKADEARIDQVAQALGPYEKAGFPVVFASAVDGRGREDILAILGRRTAVLVGPSGVGKSSLARLLTGQPLKVGELSRATERGRHTTRWCELLPAGEGLLVDTPGFQELSIEDWEEADVQYGYPEFAAWRCRFRDCLHRQEPGCAVKAAVEEGDLDRGRYERYRILVEEVHEWRLSHPRY